MIAPTGVAGTITVRRSGGATWLVVDGVTIGLGPRSRLNIDVDPDEQPCVDLRLFADHVIVDNCSYVAPDDRGEPEVKDTPEQINELVGADA